VLVAVDRLPHRVPDVLAAVRDRLANALAQLRQLLVY
jgi:hypothetical protein